MAVARAGRFTRAAAGLGVSQSASSATVRALEARLGLLTRTTRSVAPTEAGARLLDGVAPRFDAIERAVAALSEMRDKPAGTMRITAVEHAAETLLWPALARILPAYPDVGVEIVADYALHDLATGRFDAGVRLGEQVDRDMIAARIGPDFRMAVVGVPAHLDARLPPLVPQDLTAHACIGRHLPTHGGFYAWEF